MTSSENDSGPTRSRRHVRAGATTAHGVVVRALLRVIVELTTQIAALEADLTSTFEQHADATIIESLPGLGPVLGARALPSSVMTRRAYSDAKARKAYGDTAPITRGAGTRRTGRPGSYYVMSSRCRRNGARQITLLERTDLR